MIDGRMSSPEAMRPYEMLPIPTDLEIVHITLLVEGHEVSETGVYSDPDQECLGLDVVARKVWM